MLKDIARLKIKEQILFISSIIPIAKRSSQKNKYYVLDQSRRCLTLFKRGEDGVFGTERLLGDCGGSHHRILLFVITLDSLVIELLEEVT